MPSKVAPTEVQLTIDDTGSRAESPAASVPDSIESPLSELALRSDTVDLRPAQRRCTIEEVALTTRALKRMHTARHIEESKAIKNEFQLSMVDSGSDSDPDSLAALDVCGIVRSGGPEAGVPVSHEAGHSGAEPAGLTEDRRADSGAAQAASTLADSSADSPRKVTTLPHKPSPRTARRKMGIGVPGEAPLKHRVVIKICRATCVQSPMTRATCRLVQQNSGPDKIVRGDLRSTLWKRQTLKPVWNAYRELPRASDDDGIELSLVGARFRHVEGRVLGSIVVPLPSLSELADGPKERVASIPLNNCSADCQLVYQVIPLYKSTPALKTLFLVRHGQSEWNAAQKAKAYHRMLAFDHPLTTTGAAQCLRSQRQWVGDATGTGTGAVMYLRSDSVRSERDTDGRPQSVSEIDRPRMLLEREFMHADAVFVSPLTRAVQTAMVVCQGMRIADAGRKLVLLPELREVKGRGSLDTVGKYVGARIAHHALTTLDKTIAKLATLKTKTDDARAERRLAETAAFAADWPDSWDQRCVFDEAAATSPWWTQNGSRDHDGPGPNSISERVYDLACTVAHTPGSRIVLVGHSLMFRHLIREWVSETARENEPVLISQLSQAKLPNAGCLALSVDFGGDMAEIRGMARLFGEWDSRVHEKTWKGDPTRSSDRKPGHPRRQTTKRGVSKACSVM